MEKAKKESLSEKQISMDRGALRTIILLIIILIVVDFFSIIVYLSMNNKINFNNSKSDNKVAVSGECKDGTKYNECSINKPFFCYEGNLLRKAASCGCPPGYKPDFQECKKI
jgi:hypothetical protein